MNPAAVALPLRPLTVGEVLDAAASLLRGYARVLLPIGVALAVLEQLLLAPLRLLAGIAPGQLYWDAEPSLIFWLMLAVSAGTEAVIIALLGGWAAPAAGAAVLGEYLPLRRLVDSARNRLGTVALVALAAGVVVFIATVFGPLWAVGYALVGLVVPVAVLERVSPVRALWRGIVLACRAGLRAVWIRLLGYLGWFGLRLALAVSGLAALDLIGPGTGGWWFALVASTIWVAVNAVAYPTLACLDAVLHLEIRTRTEGLDILLTLARRHGRPTVELLRVPA